MSAASDAQYLTFFVGEDQFAAAAADISEVYRRARITRVPHAPQSLLGMAGLRGAPAPVISLARLIGKVDCITDASRLLLLSGEQTIALAVDRVGGMVSLPAGGAAGSGRAGFGRLYQVEDAALRMLDLDGLLQRDFAGLGMAAVRRSAGTAERVTSDDADDLVALLGFELAGQAYALPLDEVNEVITLPAQLAVIAQSDAIVLGVAQRRERLLPLVSMRRLLGLPGMASSSTRVVVARIHDARVGLAVDRLRAILRVPEAAIDPAPVVLNRGEGEAQVQSICRLPGAEGLVAILSSARLFRDAAVAQVLADGRSGDAAMEPTQTAADDAERFLIFRLGAEEYGLPLAAVVEVTRLPERLTPVPKAPAFIEGVLNLRGTVTPVIDQRQRFGAAHGDGAQRPRVIVTTVDGRPAGFVVDAVTEILRLSSNQIAPTPELTGDAGRLFRRIATLDDGARLILLIEPREMLDRAERDLLSSLDGAAASPT